MWQPKITVSLSAVEMSSAETAEEHPSPFANISALVSDHSYLPTRFGGLVENALVYIAGFVVRQILRKLSCAVGACPHRRIRRDADASVPPRRMPMGGNPRCKPAVEECATRPKPLGLDGPGERLRRACTAHTQQAEQEDVPSVTLIGEIGDTCGGERGERDHDAAGDDAARVDAARDDEAREEAARDEAAGDEAERDEAATDNSAKRATLAAEAAILRA
ncbi:unnamed protein product [Boreogadus saida]